MGEDDAVRRGLPSLTDAEVAAGRWSDEEVIEGAEARPRLRRVHLDDVRAALDTRPELHAVEVVVRGAERTSVDVLRCVRLVHLELRVSRLGERLPYRVCWRDARTRRRCVRSAVDGYSWTAGASSTLSAGVRGMR